jgi:hypothetical protein
MVIDADRGASVARCSAGCSAIARSALTPGAAGCGFDGLIVTTKAGQPVQISATTGQQLIVGVDGPGWTAPFTHDVGRLLPGRSHSDDGGACAIFQVMKPGVAIVQATTPGACDDPAMADRKPCGTPVHAASVTVTISAARR